MTDRDFDKFAVEAINRHQEFQATWEKFCDRNDFNGPYRTLDDKHRWSKRTFRYALSRMPLDHPDRWKYKIGAWYAPVMNANGKDFAVEFTIYTIISVVHTCALLAGIQAYVMGLWPLGTLLMLSIAMPWLGYMIQTYRAYLR